MYDAVVVLRLMEIRNQEKLISSYRYLASMIFNSLRRVNHSPHLRSPSEKKINRAINNVAVGKLNKVCHVFIMKNITTLVHLIPIILHLV